MAKKLPSTQQHLDIQDVKDDLVILKSSNIALVLETDSLNFELLSDEEQDARIIAFSSVLNSLNFPLQVVIRTERADMDDYVEKLAKQREKHISKALRKQMDIYIKFINNLTIKTDVLNKRFFIVIMTKFKISSKNTSFTGLLFGKKSKVNPYENLQKAKDYLYPKRNFIIKQFKKMGLKTVQLNNDELIQLYYDIYDPDKVGIKQVDITEKDIRTGVVEPLVTRGK